MKIIILMTLLLVICSVVCAAPSTSVTDDPYTILVIMWHNETGELESGVPVTFDDNHTLHTAEDGSVVFDTANLNIEDGAIVTISCKYGVKTSRINYVHSYLSGLEMVHVCQYGVGITFNEPSQSDAIAAFLALGLIAIPIGNGIYRLFKKKE